jgi:Fe-S cluster assembly protein SufD
MELSDFGRERDLTPTYGQHSMTLHITKTHAEQQLSQQFEAALPKLPGGGWVPAARRAAFNRFAALGLPHRRIEDWKYTDLRVGMKEALPPAMPAKAQTLPDLGAALGPLAALDCIQLTFVNGTFLSAEMRASQAPGKDYHAGPLAAVLGTSGYDWMKEHFGLNAPGTPGAADPTLALNTAFVTDGAVVRVEDGAKLAIPIHLVFYSDGSHTGRTTTRSLIKIGEGAHVTLIESHVGVGDNVRQTNAVTALGIGKGAHVSHIKVLDEGTQNLHTGTWLTDIGAGATYRAFQMTAGVGLARSQMFVTFSGEGATADLSGIMLAGGHGHIDTTLVADHAVPHCTSRELFKSVLRDRARAVFQGKLLVRPKAQKTDAKQMAQGLLLSDEAEFISKPELEIYADDVACGHGSTSGQIDDDLLFYLRARGIPEAQARAMLVTAFIGEALETIEHEAVREALGAMTQRWLEMKA